MSPKRRAKDALTDYRVSVVSRVIAFFQATPCLPAGTRQFRAELWRLDDELVADYSAWDESRSTAFAEAERLLNETELDLEHTFEQEEES